MVVVDPRSEHEMAKKGETQGEDHNDDAEGEELVDGLLSAVNLPNTRGCDVASLKGVAENA